MERFVTVLAQFAFATKTTVGYDPSMSRIRIDDKTRYTITINKKKYLTTKLLSDVSAAEIYGCSTRVWLCTDPEGNECVVKEQWLNYGRTPEHEVQEKILEAATSEENRKTLMRHFFTILDHERVMVGSEPDDTQKTAMRGLTLPENPVLFSTDTTEDGTVISSDGAPGSSNSDSGSIQLLPPSVQHRFHYRLVLKEVAKPLSEVDDVSEIFTVLRDGIEGASVNYS
jgi:hypothetical protein